MTEKTEDGGGRGATAVLDEREPQTVSGKGIPVLAWQR